MWTKFAFEIAKARNLYVDNQRYVKGNTFMQLKPIYVCLRFDIGAHQVIP